MATKQKEYEAMTPAERRADDLRGASVMAQLEANRVLMQARVNYAESHGVGAEIRIKAQARSNYEDYLQRRNTVEAALRQRGVVDSDIQRYSPGIATGMRIYMDRGKNPTEACMQAIKDSPLYAEGGPALAQYTPRQKDAKVEPQQQKPAARPQAPRSQSTTVLVVSMNDKTYYVQSSQLNFDDPKVSLQDNLARALADPRTKVVCNDGTTVGRVNPAQFRSELSTAQSQHEFVGLGFANPPRNMFA